MAPAKKQKTNKFSKANKREKKKQNPDESVVSGQLQKKIDKKKQKTPKDPKGVVFIKNLPHGFFEEQLRKYFEQFGNVTRVRLARSRRTGNSKGYAFVEFDYPEVAEVAAETMDNYLMFKQIVKASYIPPEKQQFNYFRTSVKKVRNKSGKEVWVSGKTASIQQKVKKHNDWSNENYQKRIKKQLKKLQKIGEKFAHLGIDINELVLQPKKLAQNKNIKGAEENKEKNLGGKNKFASDVVSSNKQNTKTSKSNVSLDALLGNTIQDDSEDEEYNVMSGSDVTDDENVESSDEETYSFAIDSDSKDIEDDDETDNEEDTKPIVRKKSKTSIRTSKASKESIVENLKRKPHVGGISKLKKKLIKKPSLENKNKTALKMMAAKELAKPLPKVKAKLSGPLKVKKNSMKLK